MVLSCSPGEWGGSPTSFVYQLSRDGTLIHVRTQEPGSHARRGIRADPCRDGRQRRGIRTAGSAGPVTGPIPHSRAAPRREALSRARGSDWSGSGSPAHRPAVRTLTAPLGPRGTRTSCVRPHAECAWGTRPPLLLRTLPVVLRRTSATGSCGPPAPTRTTPSTVFVGRGARRRPVIPSGVPRTGAPPRT
jgi:hypothetical protein